MPSSAPSAAAKAKNEAILQCLPLILLTRSHFLVKIGLYKDGLMVIVILIQVLIVCAPVHLRV
jgi:hypothetical protein